MEFELRAKQAKLKKEQEERARLQKQRKEQERREKEAAQRMRQENERAASERRRAEAMKEAAEAERAAEEERRTAGISFTAELQAIPIPGAGDKISLPPSALERLSGEGALEQTSPMLFEVRALGADRLTHTGVMEFSAEEGTCGIPPKVSECLALDWSAAKAVRLEVRYVRLPKGTSAVLQPTTAELGLAVNHQAVLEAALAGHTALTVGDAIPVSYQGHLWTVVVRELRPEAAVCVVDTDLEVHLVDPLGHDPDSSGRLEVGGEPVTGSVAVGEYQYHRFDLGADVAAAVAAGEGRVLVELEAADGGDADLYIAHHPAIYPTLHDHCWSCHDAGRKTVCINGADAAAGPFSVGVHGHSGTPRYTLRVTAQQQPAAGGGASVGQLQGADFAPCPNCSQLVPARTAELHEAYCRRHNAVCTHAGCGLVLRAAEMAEHTHCGQCGKGLHRDELEKHTQMEHTPLTCQCGVVMELAALRRHRSAECPHRLITCRFCEGLVAAGGEADDAGDRIRGLSSHEAHCGNRTRPCETCGRPVKMKDLELHHAAVHGVGSGVVGGTFSQEHETDRRCPVCGETCPGGETAMTAHVNAHFGGGAAGDDVAAGGGGSKEPHGPSGVACPICGRLFPSERHLSAHLDEEH